MQLEEVKVKARRVLRRTLTIALIGLVLAGIGYYFWRTYKVADGTKVGTLVQVVRTGYVFKTYEGQLHLVGSMQISNKSIWEFSVKNDDIYKQMEQMQGKTVECHFQELVNPFPWQGKTKFIVDGVTLKQ